MVATLIKKNVLYDRFESVQVEPYPDFFLFFFSEKL